jgi:ABC-type lipoprotein export system ATPase subunit
MAVAASLVGALVLAASASQPKYPAVVLAHEPTGHLDQNNTRAVLDALRQAADSAACVLTATHDEATAAACDAEMRLEMGRLTRDTVAARPVEER